METRMRALVGAFLSDAPIPIAGSRRPGQDDSAAGEDEARNAQAGEKKLEGDARKAFMSDCLKAGMPMSQQEKMKACNKDATAKGLKGDERKTFMSTCLTGDKKS
jgi:hypothetical protein